MSVKINYDYGEHTTKLLKNERKGAHSRLGYALDGLLNGIGGLGESKNNQSG